MIPVYRNKRGKLVEVSICVHAVERFVERFEKMFPDDKMEFMRGRHTLIEWFNNSNRIKNLSGKEKKRVRRHGPTLFFRSNAFTFIVENAQIVTVEISDKNMRHLNKSNELNKVWPEGVTQ